MANKVITLPRLGTFWKEVVAYITGQNFDTTTGSQAKADKALTDAKAYTDGKGYQTAEQVETAITDKGYQTAADVTTAVTNGTKDKVTMAQVEAKGYQDAEQVAAAVTAATGDFVTNDSLATKNYQTADNVKASVDAAKTEMQSAIDTAVSSALKYKATVAFADLPAVANAKGGDVYNISDDFVSTADFLEGEGKSFPAGTNVARMTGTAKWDILAGSVDVSGFVQKTDFVEATDEDIKGLFPKSTK